ncbi:MAG: sterol desaturase family protein [Hyphomicrobiaceae bacterium]|nr:sterol desaturase family protein [Hyphomicrobiaceae bacterium]
METLTTMGISETTLRLSAFVGIFAVLALLELAIPRRKPRRTKLRRWFTNLSIAGIDAAVVRLMALLAVPVAAVAAAAWAQANGWGLLNWLDMSAWIALPVAIILLDLAIYGQHVASHKIPLLWRLHKVHHADVEFDVTTAVRFHPVEIALSMLWKILVVLALGASPWAVVLFEVILNGCAMFNHANITLPQWLDRIVRLVLVTPDMHRVHHSVYRSEHDMNYGFNLSIWDRLFGTYKAQPHDGHVDMAIGQKSHLNDNPTRLGWSLRLPFRPPSGTRYDIDQKKLSGK